MYADKKKSQKVYVESKCVSRDDCCWDETPEMLEVVTGSNTLSALEGSTEEEQFN